MNKSILKLSFGFAKSSTQRITSKAMLMSNPIQSRAFGFSSGNSNSSWDKANNNQQQTTEQKPAEQQQTEQKPTEQQQQTQQPVVDDAKIKELQKEIETLKERNAQLEDMHKRALAEMQNVRRIAKNDVDNAKKFALQSFSKNLLDVVDNLEAGLKHMNVNDVSEIVKFVQESPNCTDEMRKKTKALLTSIEGVKLTENVLLKVLEKNGVTKIEIGEKTVFDPNFHEAMTKIPPSEQYPSNTVAMVLKSGWILNERVLRPAQVIVAIE